MTTKQQLKCLAANLANAAHAARLDNRFNAMVAARKAGRYAEYKAARLAEVV